MFEIEVVRVGDALGHEGLARSSGTGAGAARDQVAACRALPTLPELAAALRAGTLSAAQASLITPACTADPSAQHRLVELAGQVSLAELRAECARVRAAADPDPEATNRRIHGGRRLRRYTDPDGSWNLCARGTPQAGAAFNAVLDPLVDAAIRAARGSDDHEPFEAHAFDALMNLADLAARHQTCETPGHADDSPAAGAPHTAPGERTARPQDADPAADAHLRVPTRSQADAHPAAPARDTDPKTPAQEAEAAADVDDVSTRDRGRARPEDQVGDEHRPGPAARTPAKPTARTTAEQDRTGKPAAPTSTVPAPADPSQRGPDGANRERSRRRSDPRYLALLRVDLTALHRGRVTGDELCEIAGVGPIPVTIARDLLGDAVLKLVITRGIDVAHVTHLGRGPTAAQRIALAWTSPHCSVLGCPRTRAQIDHRLDWAHTRHTRLDELDPLCPYHHDLKTRHGWALVPGTGPRPFVPPHDPRHPRHSADPPSRQPQPAGPTIGQPPPADRRSQPARTGPSRSQPLPAEPTPGRSTPPVRAPAPPRRPSPRPRRRPQPTPPLIEEPDS